MISMAGQFTVGDILVKNARTGPERVAVEFENKYWTYAQLNREVNKLADGLRQIGIARGDRLAILSENRIEYCEIIYAAAKLGTLVPALNWRFSEVELKQSVLLTTPETIVISGGHFEKVRTILEELAFVRRIILLDPVEGDIPTGNISVFQYGDLVAAGSPCEIESETIVDDGLIILYTSGTTGVSKGAVISHRAMISRALVYNALLGLTGEDGFIVWAPMFHMASTDHMIATHALGGKVIITRQYSPGEIAEILERERIGWLPMMPGVIDTFIFELKARLAKIKGVKAVGAMADLVPSAQIAELTSLIGAPYLNSFGSTETGLPPATGNLIPIGLTEISLSKRESPFCQIRLVDENDRDVPDGQPGELIIRGPTLFSGYWNDPQANQKDFRSGWFHTGDVFRRNPDGTLDFVDRRKYLIKSGGENIYPAEIERVLMSCPGVQEAVVVRVRDAKWGEVPKAYVACEERIKEVDLLEFCGRYLARYKIPKSIGTVSLDKFPRSITGKIIRSEVEKWGS